MNDNGQPQCGDTNTVTGGHQNSKWDQELPYLNSGQLEDETELAKQVDPSRRDQELHELGSARVEETGEGSDAAEELGTSCWDQELGELGSSQVEES